MKNYQTVHVSEESRVCLHDVLSLTGAEVSLNRLEKGQGVPFVHAHRQNEEIYGILEGKGRAVIDGETVCLQKGDWLRIAPSAKRQFFAASDCSIFYICIQVKENSLQQPTTEDGIAF